jgi:hypothetical protein
METTKIPDNRREFHHEGHLASPRNAQKRRIDDWLVAHRDFVERETLTVIARELRKLGLYSAKTALVDIRVGVHLRCKRLGLFTAERTPVARTRHELSTRSPTPPPLSQDA